MLFYTKQKVIMNTRSKSTKNLYKVEIDFDEASNAWKSNKKYIGNGTYKYICCHKTKSGKNCSKTNLSDSNYCIIHNKLK